MQDNTSHNFIIITIIVPMKHDSVIRRENTLADPIAAAAVSGAMTKLHIVCAWHLPPAAILRLLVEVGAGHLTVGTHDDSPIEHAVIEFHFVDVSPAWTYAFERQ